MKDLQNESCKILMTGGGAPGAPGILRCLELGGNLEIWTADANPNAVGKYLCKNFITLPRADDTAFIDTVLEECIRLEVQVIMPLVTRELFHFAKHKKIFLEHGIKILVSDYDELVIANHKSLLYEQLEQVGVDLPVFKVVNGIDDFKDAIEYFEATGIRMCFKPSVSNGSRGFRIIDDHVDELDLLFNHKPDTTYISKREAIRTLSAGEFPQLLMSELLPGEEYSIDCLANQGETVIAVPRLRTKMIGGISVEGEIVNNREIIDYSVDIIKALGLHGNIGIQVKRASSGKFLLLEVNPRVQGTIVAVLGAGVNLPLLAVKQDLDHAIEAHELQVNWGTKFSRFWDEVYY